MRDKDKLYKETKARKRKSSTKIIIVVLIYVFFFTSKLTIVPPLSEATAIGVPLTYTVDRGVTIYAATYDSDAEVLEIVLNFTNSSADNVNNYYFFMTAEGRGKYDNISVDVIYEDVMITVLRASIKQFREAKLIFAPKVAEISQIPESLAGTIVFNRDNLTYEKIKERTRAEYLAYRYEISISQVKSEIENAKEEIKSFEEKIKTLEEENTELSDNIKYYTKEEEATAKRKISANKEKEENLRQSILNTESEIKTLNKRCDELELLYEENLKEAENE